MNTRYQAALYARGAGLVLGPIQEIAEPVASPFGYFGPDFTSGLAGRFGPNRYCRKVTTVKRRTVDGVRRVVSRRTRVRCTKPPAAHRRGSAR